MNLNYEVCFLCSISVSVQIIYLSHFESQRKFGDFLSGSFPPGSSHSFQWSQSPWLNFVYSPGQNTADFSPGVPTPLLVWLIKGVRSKLKTINTGIHFIKLPSSECVLHTAWATDGTLQYLTVLFFKLHILFTVIFWERSSLVGSQTDNIIRSLPILP